jgi:hypothetical protein
MKNAPAPIAQPEEQPPKPLNPEPMQEPVDPEKRGTHHHPPVPSHTHQPQPEHEHPAQPGASASI